MTINRSPRQVARARILRHTMTEGEKRLWQQLKRFRSLYGIHIRRQVPIGPWIADFAIVKRGIVIEIDGESHFTPEGVEKDRRRDAHLAELGYRVLHINTGELANNFDGCVETILRENA
ncbi:MAG: DUF559 domain-containing protein [Notoacmeibacter sp.]|nr:DUF559 domain-containing protein [Notoacmeibacter sp.]MCC0032543.1 DUF559 domain-containing protein [Brucellaceae bacterium]